MHNNVAYHSAHECYNRPDATLEFDRLFEDIKHVPIVYDAQTGKSEMYQLLPIPSWDEFFMRHVYLSALKSKDPRTKIGAVLVRENHLISTGYNGFGKGINDLADRYNDREIKYSFICHAEFNSVLQCAKFGISSDKTILYTPGFPCAECCKAIVQGGIVEIVLHKQWPNLTYSEKWVKSFKISAQMIEEAGIKVRVFDGVLGMQGVLDGKVINI
jgi:dCMP deaminase